ncbi:uncharacterized protein PHACADRAFT_201888 [Phanerochaete carnosa HHB-10118-sp]|uniref:Uncharacterized protein n=1 Tax=Phanerochaete carnosa (strain HHB-10118-sp) TaxID=650164 RepID=K5WG97_PHACS|nr:uncharacterized protein PHACADRAFT_201888 [Phanerochaete carnosa HHB-10118-sp]EKM49227.1 hypothetical protein PHACADRAFT_201888 [Phanerochaete carnosa HHB-10118-sp]
MIVVNTAHLNAIEEIDHESPSSPVHQGTTARLLPFILPRLDFDEAVPFADADNDTFVQNPTPTPLQSNSHEQPAAAGTSHNEEPVCQQPQPSGPENASDVPQLDDFKVEYHPSSGIPARTYQFDKYQRERLTAPPPAKLLEFLAVPWHPFCCRDDFEFAEVVLEAGMSQPQISRLLAVVKHIQSGSSEFSFTSHKDITTAWQRASQHHARFSKYTVSAMYNQEEHSFDVHARPLWEWVLDQVKNPLLASSFQWDAQRLYKHDGTSWVRFVDDPYTANRMWDAQSELPQGGKPLGLILSADKAKLSSFGTQNGYPVIARIANLDVETRNGKGAGGGRIVGFLPIVHEKAFGHGKPGFVNFKNVIWHKAFYKVIETIEKLSRKKKFLKRISLRDVQNVFWNLARSDPHKTLSFDRLHAYHLGLFGKHLWLEFKLVVEDLDRNVRVAIDNQAIAFPSWRGLYHFAKGVLHIEFSDGSKYEDLSKILVFISFRTLTPEISKRGYVLLKLIRRYVECDMYASFEVHTTKTIEAYRRSIQQFYETLKEYTPLCVGDKKLKDWNFAKNHSHIHAPDDILAKGVMRNFSTRRDVEGQLAKVDHWFFCAYSLRDRINAYDDLMDSILGKNNDPVDPATGKLRAERFQFNQVYTGGREHPASLETVEQSYANHPAFRNFTSRLNDYLTGWRSIQQFYETLKEYTPLCVGDKKLKDWNFAKNHSHIHAPDDILAKGVMRNFSTRRDVEGQLAKVDHWFFCAYSLRDRINAYDNLMDSILGKNNDPVDPATGKPRAERFQFNQVYTGGREHPASLETVEQSYANHPAFRNFTSRLNDYLTGWFKELPPEELPNIPRDASGCIQAKLKLLDKIIECHYLRVDYESKVTWKMVTDYLRCSSDFHKSRDSASLQFSSPFPSDFDPSARLYPSHTLTNVIIYGVDLSTNTHSSSDGFSTPRPTIELLLDEILNSDRPGDCEALHSTEDFVLQTITPSRLSPSLVPSATPVNSKWPSLSLRTANGSRS